MKVRAVFDTHWGDSGKGKVVDYLLSDPWNGEVKVNTRFNGGPNAGHTVVKNGQKTILHMLPSSILRDDVDSFIAPLCVVNPVQLLYKEIPDALSLGLNLTRLRIAKEAFTILPWHLFLEKIEEEALGKTSRDTTMRGIGPAYRDITGRYGITLGDLLNKSALGRKVDENLKIKSLIPAIAEQGWTVESLTEAFLGLGEQLSPYLVNTDDYLESVLTDPDDVLLLEGAQGNGLDVNSPCYPYVTSSGLTVYDAGKIFRIRPEEWEYIIGVCKAYSTSVGRRDFPTKLDNEIGERLRKRGDEFGATTGRPRDCGWLDGPMLRFASRINQLTHLLITKLDVLDEEPEINLCVAYKKDDHLLEKPPRLGLGNCRPQYHTFQGWQQPTYGVREIVQLPIRAQTYLEEISFFADVPLIGISTGPETNDTIWIGVRTH